MSTPDLCPEHSTGALHVAVRANRRLDGVSPQPCTCSMSRPDRMLTLASLHQRGDDQPSAHFIEAGGASQIVVRLSSATSGPTVHIITPDYLAALIRELSNVAVAWDIARHEAEVPC